MWREHVLNWLFLHLFCISLTDIISANFIVFILSVNICSSGVIYWYDVCIPWYQHLIGEGNIGLVLNYASTGMSCPPALAIL